MSRTGLDGRRRAGDAGQALPLVVVLVALAAVAALVLAELGAHAVARARARGAADAAALAGAVEGRAGAEEIAGGNGATLTSYQAEGPIVDVVVELDGVSARARAEATGPTRDAPPGGGNREGLAPVMVAAIARAEQLLGRPVPVVSGFRSRGEQERLWANRAANPFPVALTRNVEPRTGPGDRRPVLVRAHPGPGGGGGRAVPAVAGERPGPLRAVPRRRPVGGDTGWCRRSRYT